ncbi:MAG: YdcF family protein, partial [Lachnospiraceae bacterium]|nr:YdcF family protein [Lachnospiraceae bacterium]
MRLVAQFYGRFRHRVPIRLEVSVVTVLAAIVVVFVSVLFAMGFNFFSLKKQSADYVIVLGTQVQGETVSKMLENRLDKAYEYAKVHPNTVFILSGGKGEGEDISEAQAMYDYLKKRGVPEYQMIMEDRSVSTYENLVFSKILIDEREKNRRSWIKDLMNRSGYLVPPDEEVTIRVGIVTSNFHVLRAKGIAKHIGLPNVSGIAAKSDPVMFLHFCVRECFAILKDKFVGNM